MALLNAHGAPDAAPYTVLLSPNTQSDPQQSVAGPSAPCYRPTEPQQSYTQCPGSGSSGLSYRPTDPQSYPRYPGSGPYASYRPAEPKQHLSQHLGPSAFAPAYQTTTEATQLEPRFIRATQTGPGQYMPSGGAFAGGLRPIQVVQPQESPFITDARSSFFDGGGDRVLRPKDRSFLKSNIKPHAEYCSDAESDEMEDPCLRETSESPSVRQKERGGDKGVLVRRVEQLEEQIVLLKEAHEKELALVKTAHEMEVAKLKSRASRVFGNAVYEISGIEKGSQLWQDLVQEALRKMDDISENEDGDEDEV
ncbi:hypothetical protein VP1G_01055 [Cytospora mali]|uniref:Uncharacterized protein n=1 Tax=Cytospora mali TaxID=578113 RepID=A0A194UPE6_CYTMA|nr:hypothetical protein VP1G_01055 [Valsa mali var. pyri (nom. inval.)]